MSAQVVIINHNDGPVADRILQVLTRNGFDPVVFRPFLGDTLPTMTSTIVGSIILGGKFDACEIEKYPFLKKENTWIADCIAADIPLLGICQGAQQIAFHLGAKVGAPEIPCIEFGYYEITPTPQAGDFMSEKIFVSQFHYHTFEIPAGAVKLAGSDLYLNQAFRFGDKVFAIQWHSEVTPQAFAEWRKLATEFEHISGAQTEEHQNALAELHDEKQAIWFEEFLLHLFGRAVDYSGLKLF